MSNQADAIMMLVERGWHPYTGQVEAIVYQQLDCPAPAFAKWLYEGEAALEAMCVGCERQCKTSCEQGFKPAPKRLNALFKGVYFTLAPLEMVQRKHLLNVYEAAYCLNCSDRLIYRWIDEGILRRTKRQPVRVAAQDVFRLMNDFDE